jgi:hypothetical protein
MPTPTVGGHCPKCSSSEHTSKKLLLIDRHSIASHIHELGISQGLSENLRPNEASHTFDQFVEGLYCAACGTGFLTDEIAIICMNQYLAENRDRSFVAFIVEEGSESVMRRVRLSAKSIDEAEFTLESTYGKGAAFSLYDEESSEIACK